jgi:uncharacterized protein YndB with AHSA1/START domain
MNLNRTSMERTSDKEIVIKRSFRAPAEIVFDAWTKPENVRRWWAPASRGVTLVQCDADVRPAARTATCSLAGKPSASRFPASTWRSRAPPAWSTRRASSPCRGRLVVTVSFEEKDGSTTLVAHELYPLEGSARRGPLVGHGGRHARDV